LLSAYLRLRVFIQHNRVFHATKVRIASKNSAIELSGCLQSECISQTKVGSAFFDSGVKYARTLGITLVNDEDF